MLKYKEYIYLHTHSHTDGDEFVGILQFIEAVLNFLKKGLNYKQLSNVSYCIPMPLICDRVNKNVKIHYFIYLLPRYAKIA